MSFRVGKGIGAFLISHHRNTSQNFPIRLSSLKDSNNQPLLDTNESFHLGWQFLKKANWPTDGLSLHFSQASTALPFGGFGFLTCWQARFHREIPRPEKFRPSDPTLQIIERLAWGQPINKSPLFLDRSWRVDLGFVGPTLQGGVDNKTYNNRPCLNPNEGYAALDPDFNNASNALVRRFDDYRWRVEAGVDYQGGSGFLFFSESAYSAPVKIGGVLGSLSLDVGGGLFSVGPLPMGRLDSKGGGGFSLDLGVGNSLLRKFFTSFPAIHAQSLVVKAGKAPWLSSLWTFRPLLKPKGFTRGVTTSGTPISLVKTAARRVLFLRNDGPGGVQIVNYLGNTRIGPITTVPERMAMKISLASKANRIQIETKKTGRVDVTFK
jgi:hypothetical protein